MQDNQQPVLETQTIDGIVTLTKNNPQDNYGMSLATLKAMGEALDTVKDSPAIRAVVIDAGGRGFHAGAVAVTELRPRLEDLNREDFQRLVKMGHKLGNQIAALPIPVIGVARGGALGGGLELLLRSDFLYCLDGARFSFPEVTLGFVAAWGGTQLAARLMPFRRAQEMLLLGESINGIQAAEFGLVTASFATAEVLDARLRDVLARLRHCSPASVRWTKECLEAAWEGSLDLGLDREMEAETETMDSGDFLKGLGALGNGQVYDYSAGKAVAKKSR
ncbi:enoyl-CoA hydratase/isomerase family protein [SAR92 clade bacterium H455]|uniref:Enoyl-CoA hydratase/isomerase family protein n=1 Tax=SAR92 clade bacterium H455 TaxID=2974818 RepID=A0ABY5TQA2_9GAMM|nr:enoyl-CoA hydratase/isomerase family protein [SAR92 clade bacterium H455]